MHTKGKVVFFALFLQEKNFCKIEKNPVYKLKECGVRKIYFVPRKKSYVIHSWETIGGFGVARQKNS